MSDPVAQFSSPFIYFTCDRAPTVTEDVVAAFNIPSNYAFFWWDQTNDEMYEFQGGSNGSYIWQQRVTPQNIDSHVATVAISGDYDDLSNKPTIPSAPTQTTESRALNTAFQIDATKYGFVFYSVDIEATSTLTTQEKGTVYLKIASDEEFTEDVQTLASCTNGNDGTLVLGLTSIQTITANLVGFIPPGYWVKIETEDNEGTPVFTYKFGQKVLY